MLSSRRFIGKAFGVNKRFNSSIPSVLYSKVWQKSTILYITYVVSGCIILEGIYGTATTLLWDTCNAGKQYKDIDWTRFKSEDDE